MKPTEAEDPEKCHDRALRLLAYRARSAKEIRERLTRIGFTEVLVEDEVRRLARVGLLDDGAFAAGYAHHAVEVRRVGRRAITVELDRRGIAPAMVEQVTAKLTPEAEEERALALARKRAARLRDVDVRKAYGRLSGFLFRRGFDGDVVRQVCRQVLAERVDETEPLES